MEKWLIRELEHKARMEQYEAEGKARLTVKCHSDFDVKNPLQIRSLNIDQFDGTIDNDMTKEVSKFVNLESINFGSRYQGQLSPNIINAWLHTLPLVRKLSIFSRMDNSMTWSSLAALDLSRIESLTVSMQSSEQPIRLVAPGLKEFTLFGSYEEELSPLEKRCLDRIWYDFSGMPALRKLQLSYCGFWNYESLSSLHRLESLRITDRNLTNLSWLSSKYSLTSLAIFACIDDLFGIETQPHLEELFLDYNDISDVGVLAKLSCLKRLSLKANHIYNVAPIENLERLEYLNLERNPIQSEGKLRSKGIDKVLLSSQDLVIESIERVIASFSQQVYWQIKNEDNCDLSQLPEWRRMTILKNRQMSYKERLIHNIQAAFEQEYQRINPFDLRAYDLSVNLRNEYILRAIVRHYPFLKVTTNMASILQREKNLNIVKIPEIPGITFFADEDFVRIYVKAKSGSGKISQGYDKNYIRYGRIVNSQKIESLIKKNWGIFFPGNKITEYDFEIVYAPLYGKDVDTTIVYAVLYAMWSAVHQIVLPQKTAVLLKCSKTGRLCKEEATLIQIKVSLQQRIEEIISWRPKKKAVRHSVKELTLFNTLEEFTEVLHRQEKEHYRYKDLDDFGIKLVNVLQEHIPDIADQRRIQSVLRDVFPDKKKNVNLLVLLLQMNILEKIKNQPVIDGLFVSNFISLLENDYGIGIENARYAVHTWCLCYGKYVLDKPCKL